MNIRATISSAAALGVAILAAAILTPGAVYAQSATAPSGKAVIDADHLKKAADQVDKGMAFLLKARNAEGGWGFDPKESHPALTALAVKVLVDQPGGPEKYKAQIEQGYKALLKFRQADGGFYNPKEGNQNYCTSIAVMALAVSKDAQHKPALADAIKFLRGQQIVPGSKTPAGEDIDEKHPYVGGVSYGKQGRPDLSNLGMWMEAMHEAGVAGDDPAMQRAAAFATRLQDRSEGKTGEAFTFKGADGGGFIYAMNKKDGKFIGESQSTEPDGGLRSYGSMTYTGFKSMLYANIAKDDARVKAAYEWIRRYWRLDANPNMPDASSRQGLYYYYHVFAKALKAWGQDIIPDTKDVKHNWRHELIDILAQQQKPDGSWANESDRWMEGSPVLVTSYAVMAIQEATE